MFIAVHVIYALVQVHQSPASLGSLVKMQILIDRSGERPEILHF